MYVLGGYYINAQYVSSVLVWDTSTGAADKWTSVASLPVNIWRLGAIGVPDKTWRIFAGGGDLGRPGLAPRTEVYVLDTGNPAPAPSCANPATYLRAWLAEVRHRGRASGLGFMGSLLHRSLRRATSSLAVPDRHVHLLDVLRLTHRKACRTAAAVCWHVRTGALPAESLH